MICGLAKHLSFKGKSMVFDENMFKSIFIGESKRMLHILFNQFVPSAPFPYLLKTSENLMVF